MDWKSFVQKYISRKFLLALLSVVIGVLIMMGADDNTIQLVSGLGTASIGIFLYIIVEGRLDAAALKQVDIETIIDVVCDYLEAKYKIELPFNDDEDTNTSG